MQKFDKVVEIKENRDLGYLSVMTRWMRIEHISTAPEAVIFRKEVTYWKDSYRKEMVIRQYHLTNYKVDYGYTFHKKTEW